uniref:dUTPase-like domain-containing protein n=1 Tax=Macaca fascicularis TaxID=9541 RepID=A0A7N9CA62_MACFA
MLPPGDPTTIPLNWKLRLPPGHFGLLLPLNQQAKKGVIVQVIYPDYQDEISLLFHNRSKKEYAWNTGDPLGCLLVLLCPVIQVNGKLQWPNPSRTTNCPGPSGMKFCVTPPRKNPPPAEVLAESKGNTEYVVEECSHEYQL